MTPEDQRALAISCVPEDDKKEMEGLLNDGSCIFMLSELADYTATVEAKERERCILIQAQLNHLYLQQNRTAIEETWLCAATEDYASAIRSFK